jgi:hypothetical protein
LAGTSGTARSSAGGSAARYAPTATPAAVEWSAGFSIAQIGFNAIAQTGYDADAAVHFDVQKKGTCTSKELCGTNDYPGGTPRRLAAKG